VIEKNQTKFVFFDNGFRPFFLLAALWAILSILIWIRFVDVGEGVRAFFGPRDWHLHAMLSGYVSAVIAGFLLTAVPNWTGTPPLKGRLLILLTSLWLAGRIAVLYPSGLAPVLVAIVDLSFLAFFIGFVSRALLKSGNSRNFVVVGLLSLLWLGLALMHMGRTGDGGLSSLGGRLGLTAVLLLITLIGGRVIPAFTGNWLRGQNEMTLPADFGLIDKMSIASSLLALLSWSFQLPATVSALLFVLASGLGIARLARWQGWKTCAEPLVLVMHVAYLWLPIGYLMMGGAMIDLWPQSIGLHGLTVGAIGTMTLAIMCRATLGHSGRALAAGPMTVVLFGLITLSAILRVFGPLITQADWPISSAGLAWVAAFAIFLAAYGPMFFKAKAQ
jgi:uncharacterized protein involved in response to NO